MLELLPFDDESPSFLDELAEEMDTALDASFLAELSDVFARVKRAREELSSAIA